MNVVNAVPLSTGSLGRGGDMSDGPTAFSVGLPESVVREGGSIISDRNKPERP